MHSPQPTKPPLRRHPRRPRPGPDGHALRRHRREKGSEPFSHDLYGWWPRIRQNSTAAPLVIKHADGTATITIDQTATGHDWVHLGRYAFAGDGSEYVDLTDANGAVAADSVRWVKNLQETAPTVETAVYYMHNDHLGTPHAMTDSLGNAVWRATYGPFGQTGVDEDPDGDGTVLSLNLAFPGQYYDKETGLHYNYYRTYDPSIGRYLESDPIGLRGGLNTYSYVGNSPLNYTDPFGLWRWPGDIYDDATSDTTSKFTNERDRWNGPGDAYRHCLASCMMTRENGKATSEFLGWANEKRGDWTHNQNPKERAMDDWNNSCGNKLGGSAGSDQDCKDRCMNELINGGLKHGQGGSFPGNGYWY